MCDDGDAAAGGNDSLAVCCVREDGGKERMCVSQVQCIVKVMMPCAALCELKYKRQSKQARKACGRMGHQLGRG